MDQNALSKAVIRQIVAHARCAVCGHSFTLSDVHVIGQRDNAWAMSVKCRECRTQALMLAVVANGATHSVYTDLTPNEWKRFTARPPIAFDDVIGFYSYLDAYTGDFSEILDEPLEE